MPSTLRFFGSMRSRIDFFGGFGSPKTESFSFGGAAMKRVPPGPVQADRNSPRVLLTIGWGPLLAGTDARGPAARYADGSIMRGRIRPCQEASSTFFPMVLAHFA